TRQRPKSDDYLAMPLHLNVGDIGKDVSKRQILTTSISPKHDLPGVQTLIDTCCSVSLVSSEHANYLQRLGYRCGKVAPPIEVGMASDEVMFRTDMVQEVPVCFDGFSDHCVRLECPIIAGLQWPLILGINHLTSLNAKINCVDRLVQIEYDYWRTVLDCTESVSGGKSSLVANTVDLLRCNTFTLLQPGLNENPWIKDIGISSTGHYSVVEGPLDESSITFGSISVLVVNNSSTP
ncbi:hypothetical protein FOL47_004661, partial [Perkinsus chesapeaki]